MTNDEERPEIGDIVETESGSMYPVVGREQGGRTMCLPSGPGGATREFWPKNLEIVEKDASMFTAYQSGLANAPVDEEVAEVVASLAIEGHIKTSALPMLFSVIGEDGAVEVADKMESKHD